MKFKDWMKTSSIKKLSKKLSNKFEGAGVTVTKDNIIKVYSTDKSYLNDILVWLKINVPIEKGILHTEQSKNILTIKIGKKDEL